MTSSAATLIQNSEPTDRKKAKDYGIIFQYLAFVSMPFVFTSSLLKGGINPQTIIDTVNTNAFLYATLMVYGAAITFSSIGMVISTASNQNQSKYLTGYSHPISVLAISLILLPIGHFSILQRIMTSFVVAMS